MSQQEPKSLKEARYALFLAEGKLYSVSHDWNKVQQSFLKELEKHYKEQMKA